MNLLKPLHPAQIILVVEMQFAKKRMEQVRVLASLNILEIHISAVDLSALKTLIATDQRLALIKYVKIHVPEFAEIMLFVMLSIIFQAVNVYQGTQEILFLVVVRLPKVKNLFSCFCFYSHICNIIQMNISLLLILVIHHHVGHIVNANHKTGTLYVPAA